MLPKHVETKITFFQKLQPTTAKYREENKFKINLKVKICTESEAEDYIKAFEDRSQSNFKRGRKIVSGVKQWIHRTSKCERNVKTNIQDHSEDARKPGEGRGSGRQEGVPRQVGKHTGRMKL